MTGTTCTCRASSVRRADRASAADRVARATATKDIVRSQAAQEGSKPSMKYPRILGRADEDDLKESDFESRLSCNAQQMNTSAGRAEQGFWTAAPRLYIVLPTKR